MTVHDLLIFGIGFALGAVAGARWMWRIVDKALREFETDEHEGSIRYRIGKHVL